MDTGNFYIDGPLNMITLFSPDASKRMAIIADFHEDKDKEKGCNKNSSIEISDFIKIILSKSSNLDNLLHFFIETIPTNHNGEHKMPTDRFADKVISLLMNEFSDKLEQDDGIARTSNRMPNVVLHFVDIRNIVFPDMDLYFVNISEAQALISCLPQVKDDIWEKLLENVQSVYKMMKLAYDNFFHMDPQNSIELEHLLNSNMLLENGGREIANKLIFNKMKNSFNDDKIKYKFAKYINGELKDNFTKFFKMTEKLENLILEHRNSTGKRYQYKDTDGGIIYTKPYIQVRDEMAVLDKMIYEFNHIWFVDLTSKIMDLYFLRKFLNDPDMKYVVSYTEIEHSMFALKFLIEYFDYRIDGISLLNDITKSELTYKIKQSKGKDFHKYVFPKEFIQCAVIDGFTLFRTN